MLFVAFGGTIMMYCAPSALYWPTITVTIKQTCMYATFGYYEL